MKTSSIPHECAVNLVGVLLQEMAGLLSPTMREHRRRHNLFTELACETCNGTGLVTASEEHTDDCPDCSQHGFTIPTECYCRTPEEEQGQEPCLYCRGQQVRTERKEWS